MLPTIPIAIAVAAVVYIITTRRSSAASLPPPRPNSKLPRPPADELDIIFPSNDEVLAVIRDECEKNSSDKGSIVTGTLARLFPGVGWVGVLSPRRLEAYNYVADIVAQAQALADANGASVCDLIGAMSVEGVPPAYRPSRRRCKGRAYNELLFPDAQSVTAALQALQRLGETWDAADREDAVRSFQADANASGLTRRAGDTSLLVDGIPGVCTLIVLEQALKENG